MPPKISRLLSSEIFEVVAGLDHKTYWIHGDILASNSEPLWVTVSNQISGQKQRVILIENHNGATVGRLAEFLYTGDYEAPGPMRIQGPPVGGPTPPPGSVSARATTQHSEPEGEISTHIPESVPVTRVQESSQQKPAEFTPEDLSLLKRALGESVSPPSETLRGTLTPADTPEATSQQEERELPFFGASLVDHTCYDYKDTFLAHVQVCALAHNLEIHSLEDQATRRLLDVFRSIGHVSPNTRVVTNFADLMDYAYTNTTGEELRKILLEFFSQNIKILMADQMMKLVSRGGDLVQDVVAVACRNLVISENKRGQLILKVANSSVELNCMCAKYRDCERLETEIEIQRTENARVIATKENLLRVAQDRILELEEEKRVLSSSCDGLWRQIDNDKERMQEFSDLQERHLLLCEEHRNVKGELKKVKSNSGWWDRG